MDIWRVRGGRKLEGTAKVQGSKNASLPILAASILCPARTELTNVPQLKDVDAALLILRDLGCTAVQEENRVFIDSSPLLYSEIPFRLMKEMRSSVIFLGALAARCGVAKLSLPGGCRLGKRPIDLHLDALRQMGAYIEENDGEIYCRADELKGAEISLSFPSVGATENIMLAGCGARGKTVIRGAAREPEITALQDYLNSLGAVIYGAGSSEIVIESFTGRRQVRHKIIPDRIVASTICCCTAAAGGRVELKNILPEHFFAVSSFLKRSGCDIIIKHDSLIISSDGVLHSPGRISTRPYPGFPTDAQPVLMAALLKAEGETTITENIFENRFRQAEELKKLGAKISVEDKTARITGTDRLIGNTLNATDLRGGASMIVAGLSAEGETVIRDEGHIRRGYDSFDRCLRAIGADISLETG